MHEIKRTVFDSIKGDIKKNITSLKKLQFIFKCDSVYRDIPFDINYFKNEIDLMEIICDQEDSITHQFFDYLLDLIEDENSPARICFTSSEFENIQYNNTNDNDFIVKGYNYLFLVLILHGEFKNANRLLEIKHTNLTPIRSYEFFTRLLEDRQFYCFRKLLVLLSKYNLLNDTILFFNAEGYYSTDQFRNQFTFEQYVKFSEVKYLFKYVLDGKCVQKIMKYHNYIENNKVIKWIAIYNFGDVYSSVNSSMYHELRNTNVNEITLPYIEFTKSECNNKILPNYFKRILSSNNVPLIRYVIKMYGNTLKNKLTISHLAYCLDNNDIFNMCIQLFDEVVIDLKKIKPSMAEIYSDSISDEICMKIIKKINNKNIEIKNFKKYLNKLHILFNNEFSEFVLDYLINKYDIVITG